MENLINQNPLENPQQKRIIDEIIAQNLDKKRRHHGCTQSGAARNWLYP